MSDAYSIQTIRAREILSSGALPTIETEVILSSGVTGRASVPFGASFGAHEAFLLVDKDKKRFMGFGMKKAVKHVDFVASKLMGMDVRNQASVDALMKKMDGTPHKRKLGANVILSVSLACARAAAAAVNMPLYAYLRSLFRLPYTTYIFPRPLMVVLEGGLHADQSTDVQEYLIAPARKKSIADSVRMGIEVYLALKSLLKEKGLNTNVGNEGAYAPPKLPSNETPFLLIRQALQKAGYTYKNIQIGIDSAASEFYKGNQYVLGQEQKSFSVEALIEMYSSWIRKYKLFYLEDPLAEDDWNGWSLLYKKLGARTLVVGDDLTVTQQDRLKQALENNTINAVIIKPNQVGTLTETAEVMQLAHKHNLSMTVSHRGGGETNDTFIIDLAVAFHADFVKVGPSRGERVEKYNRLMEIERELASRFSPS